MAKNITLLKIDGLVLGKITVRPKGAVFALSDERGMHLSLSRKTETAFHVELSSDQALGSVWDETRIGIASALGWRHSERHANYLINCEYDIAPTFDPLRLVSFTRPKEPPIQKERYARVLSLDLNSNGPWDELEVSLLFSNMPVPSGCAVFPLGWTSILFRVTRKDSE